ncbi:hypothetical protein [Streptomyces sp. NPDC059378]|uniref:hypothetical protein n=1 Tax=Streptomyces sp. NPDC059378 TaxID=3346815 RepID=UPI0036A5D1E2
MNDTLGLNWKGMTPDNFGHDTKLTQDALFLVGEPDACGSEPLDGYGYGATLWGGQPEADRLVEYPFWAIEPDGTIHAAECTGDQGDFTAACGTSPAPIVDRLEVQRQTQNHLQQPPSVDVPQHSIVLCSAR